MKKLIYLFFLFASILILSACGDETINFTISFDTNGGDTIESVEYNGEQTFIVPTQITKEGFTFNGWFLDDDIFEIPFTIDLLIDGTISDDVVVYAKWTINQYQITFINDDQTIISTLLLDYQADLANIAYPQHPVKEGYEFITWDKTLPQTMPAEHITLQAVYEIETFNLIFIDDQGVLISTLTYPFNSDLSNVVIPEAPSKEGHVFSSWNKEIPSTMPATDVTIQALYSINQYNIHFLDFDGSVISNETYDYGTELTVDDYPTEPIRVGYTFTGWSEALPITMPASNLVLKANYTINTYVISFITEENLVIDSQSFNYGADLSNITIPQEPIKEGYEFIGWFYQDELWTGLDVMIDEDIILVATYEMIYYTIDYELNGGSFELVTPPLVYSIDSITFDFIEPIKEGYEFAGWYHNSDFTGELVTSIQIGSTGNLTLYAKWIEVVVPSFDPTELNAIFGFDIYQLMPEIVTSDYLVLDYSDLEYYEVYLDIFDWSEAEAITYINLLDDMLAYDEIEESWMIGNYFIYVYEDTETYEGEVVYGVGIYGERQETNEPTNPFNPNDLNAIFGFDIYQLMPDIISDDTIIYDFSTTTDYAVYIDLFDWIESDANTFVNGLDSLLVYDDIEESWILGDYYIYIYLDTESYPGEEVYSIYIYGSKEETGEPIDNLSVLTPRISINEFEKMSFGQSGLPSVGTFNVLVIPVEINGVPFPIDYFAKLDLVFNGSSSATGWESVASYYQKSSYGLLNLTFDISSKYTTTYSRSYYENMGQQGDQYAILETLLAKDPTIDFSQYDSNNDGLIDSVIFIYSTNYDYDTDPWWAWVYAAKYGEASVADDLDGKAFEYYMWASYAFLEDGLPNANQLVVNAETYIHEVGHLMGAVDLYSYTSTYGPMGGMGMMDYNNGDHEPMHKLLFGWLQPLVVYEGSHLIELESYALDQDGINSAIIIPYLSTNFSDGNAFDEFIIIIFYTPEGLYEAHQGYDYVLNESAVIVYHVDARMLSNTGFWQGYFAKDNDGTSDFIMQILEADYNDSIPGDLQQIDISDVLTQGIFNLSNYQWNQGGSMNIEIELSNPILETDDSVSIIVSINPR